LSALDLSDEIKRQQDANSLFLTIKAGQTRYGNALTYPSQKQSATGIAACTGGEAVRLLEL
jgi:hypothetical protein